ncbi:MAG: hypothetical protein K2G12_05010 [Prevotella sp.]|nr:hypothetical protein [Prevotella sp.]
MKNINGIVVSIFILVLGVHSKTLYGEEKHIFPFIYVDVPDSISSVLASAYGRADCNAEHNVRNMTIRNDVEFQNGIYVFNGMGPHFKHMIFIFKKQIYVFKQAIEYATVDGMLAELAECGDSLRLTEAEMSLYKKVVISAIKEGILFLEDTSNRKVKVHKPFPTNVIVGTWLVQIKCQRMYKRRHWTRLYGSYLTLQHVHQDMVSVQDSIYGNCGRGELHTMSYVTGQCLYKIVKMFRSKSKFYMIITRRIGNKEYESYYLSKNIM